MIRIPWRRGAFALLVFALCSPATAQVQTNRAYTTTADASDIRPFLARIPDATITRGVDLEPVVEFGNFDNGSTVGAAAYASIWIAEDLEVGGRWGFLTVDPDVGNGESGLEDIRLYGRYRLPLDGDIDFALGSELTLPVGAGDVGQSNFDFRAFGAMRYDVDGTMVVLANAGIQSLERGPDRETGITVGGGVILPMTEELAIVSELDLWTTIDYAAISGGLDYELPPGGHLRAALALGLDDAAPDVQIIVGFAIPVY